MKELDTARLRYPRISDIIGKQTEREMRSIPIDALVTASIRGTKVHNYCTAYLRGLWMSDIETEYLPYVETFMRWADENVYQTLYSNVRLYDDVKRFTGAFDLICVLKSTKQIALLDLKSAAKESIDWPVKMAAYKHLCEINGYDIEAVYNIHLKMTKAAIYEEIEGKKIMLSPPIIKAVEIPHKNLTPYWEIFNSALSCYNYFDRKEEAHA